MPFHNPKLENGETLDAQRLAQLDKLYSVVHTEVNEQKMLWVRR